jgi:tRNA (cmo5U34)-methyltransferase
MKRDRVFRAKGFAVEGFEFNSQVVSVFDDMVNRSVPHYATFQQITADIAVDQLSSVPGVMYDLGCSTGTTLERVGMMLPRRPRRTLIGVDASQEMLLQAERKLKKIGLDHTVRLETANILDMDFKKPASVISMLFVLQFLRPPQRQKFLSKCRDALLPGGCLLLGEKILGESAVVKHLLIKHYHNMKLRAGYTHDEVQRKRESLENVLVPYTISENVAALLEARFKVAEVIFQCYNFGLIVAFR